MHTKSEGTGLAIGGGSGDVKRDINPIFLAGRDEDPISLVTNGGGSSCIHGGGSAG